jgi:hypothetical protein
MILLAAMWGGSWWGAVPPVVGDTLLDVNGVTITLGATVKLVGTVTAINPDPHFGSITVAPAHPTGKSIPMQSGGGNPQSPNFPVPNQQLPVKTYGFEPLQLVVGS